MRTKVIQTLAVGALAMAASACGGDATTVSGMFVLADADGFTGDWNRCSGDGGYSDFGPGMNVTIRNGEGSIVGSGSTRSLGLLDLPESTDDEAESSVGDLESMEVVASYAEAFDGFRCVVAFETEIEKADFYQIEIGRRGELTYSADELAERDFFVELTLGG